MSSPIPAFYRICFTVVDPILTTVGLLCNIFAPIFIVKGYTPHAITPPPPETLILLDTTAGFLACILFLTLVLQRKRPADLGLWRMLHFGIMLAEVAMLVGLVRLLRGERRLKSGGVAAGGMEQYWDYGYCGHY